MFRFFKKTQPTRPLPDLRNVAETTLRYREREWVYRDGVVQEAVKRASIATSIEGIIDAIEAVFIEYEWGRRDEYDAIAAEFGLFA